MRICKIEKCRGKHYGLGYCHLHWQRQHNGLAVGGVETFKGSPTHRMSKTKIYGVWSAMIERCGNPNNRGYKWYGARGIKVCQRWHKFANFYTDMGDKPAEGYELDRIDNDGNYEPGNVKWSTSSEQKLNKGLDSRNKSGVTGVRFRPAYARHKDKWIASFQYKGKEKRRYFATKEEAVECRQQWIENKRLTIR